jgi:acetyl-CoA synthetase
MPLLLTRVELTAAGLEPDAAQTLIDRVSSCQGLPAAQRWRRISQEMLTPAHPFAVHRLVYERVFAGWDRGLGPPPAWIPPEGFAETTNLHRLMVDLGLRSYADLHAWSVANRECFWEKVIACLGIRFGQPYSQIRAPQSGVEAPRWLVGARLNIVDSCFAADSQAPAVVFQPEGEALQRWSYGELRALTDRVACSLGKLGLRPGDAVAVDLPMTAESVAVYLGIVKAGCVVVAIADSLAPGEIQIRLRLGSAKAIFTQDVIGRAARRLPLYEKVVAAAGPPAVVLPCDGEVSTPLREGDQSWAGFLGSDEEYAAVMRGPEDPVNVLFSSGTTGTPKAIPWTQTTPIKCAADSWLHHDLHPGDVVAWPSGLGWMMGPWLIYASLINRATMALGYSPPAGRTFGRFVQDARVNVLGVVPSLVKIWRTSGCMEGLDWSAVDVFSSTGECSNPEDMLYLMMLAGYKPIIEYCGGTEIGGAYITGTVVQPASPATFTTPALGLDVHIADDQGRPAPRGEVYLVPPSIGLSNCLIGEDHYTVYFADTPTGPQGQPLRRHGDEMERLGGGYYRAHGRVDDTMNLHGIKVSSSEIERVVATVEGIREAAAIAVPPVGGGPEELVIYAVLTPGPAPSPRELKAAVQRAIRTRLSNAFKVQEVVPVESLPRTASNKVMRRTMRHEYAEGRRR